MFPIRYWFIPYNGLVNTSLHHLPSSCTSNLHCMHPNRMKKIFPLLHVYLMPLNHQNAWVLVLEVVCKLQLQIEQYFLCTLINNNFLVKLHPLLSKKACGSSCSSLHLPLLYMLVHYHDTYIVAYNILQILFTSP